jgi:aminocarboxymuconate-semialdehyde decarboxylase
VFERQPDAVVIAHHLGGMIPFVAPRIEAHYMRLDDPDLQVPLARNPIEYLRQLCGDTAINGGAHAVRCGVEFFGSERVLFGSDYPFDGQAGVMYIDRALAAVDEAGFEPSVRDAILAGNVRRLLRLA